MYPILLQWGSIVLPSWHVFYVLGAIAAFYVLNAANNKANPNLISEKQIINVYLWAYVLGYLGARLGSSIFEEHAAGMDLLTALFRLGPMMSYGGALGGALGVIIYAVWKNLPLRYLVDLSVPAFLVAMGIGRVGCFLNGDDYGKAVPSSSAEAWWAVTFPNLNDGIARYPVQLIEAAFTLVLSWILFQKLKDFYRSYSTRSGVLGLCGVLGYSVFRFFIEFYRDDYRGDFLFGWMSPAQAISIALAVLSVTLILQFRRQSFA